MYEYEKNNWKSFDDSLPVGEQVDAIITKKKLDRMEDGIQRASMTIEAGKVSVGERGAVSVTTDETNHRHLINVVFPETKSTGGSGIDDDSPSDHTTYSSSKIVSLIDDLREQIEKNTPAPTPITITSFTADVSTVELGTVVQFITFRWETSIPPVKVWINDSIITNPGFKSSRYPAMISNTTTYRLTVEDEYGNKASKSLTVTFANVIYYGVSSTVGAVDSQMQTVLSNNLNMSFTVDTGTDRFIQFASPARLGEPRFYQGGFEGGFELIGSGHLENNSGYSEVYNMYKSCQSGLGRVTIKVEKGA